MFGGDKSATTRVIAIVAAKRIKRKRSDRSHPLRVFSEDLIGDRDLADLQNLRKIKVNPVSSTTHKIRNTG